MKIMRRKKVGTVLFDRGRHDISLSCRKSKFFPFLSSLDLLDTSLWDRIGVEIKRPIYTSVHVETCYINVVAIDRHAWKSTIRVAIHVGTCSS